jgi:phosphatidylserine/phosphatidylglycerophosphate/cardiolipin synthase-like enzyme
MNRSTCLLSLMVVLASGTPAAAQYRFCDPGDENCRTILINYIRNETRGIDVAFWFMEDARYTTELIKKHRAGVPVRVLIDPRANVEYPLNAERLRELQQAGIPMRKRLTSYILHWKMMLFHGQNVVQFSGANYSANAWRPAGAPNYSSYVDEAIVFASDPPIVATFRTKFDDQWIDRTKWADYANIRGPLVRRYVVAPQHPSLNFPPDQNYRTRSLKAYRAEGSGIDAIMFRITDRAHTDALLAAVQRGVPVRLITEPQQYRLRSRMWHAWNVDRLYMGGVQVRHRAHAGLNHQKSVILNDQNRTETGRQSLVIFGSSNWTSPSAGGQLEHNMFTGKSMIVSWFVKQFRRKWTNSGGAIETLPFAPLKPDTPKAPVPAHGATGVPTNLVLRWTGGPWAHMYDVYLGTSSNPTTRIATSLPELTSKTATSAFRYETGRTLARGTRYYWKVVGKTMALQTRASPVWSFTTSATAAPARLTARDAAAMMVTEMAMAPLEPQNSAAGAGAAESASNGATRSLHMTFSAEPRRYQLWIRGLWSRTSWMPDLDFELSVALTPAGLTWHVEKEPAVRVKEDECYRCGKARWDGEKDAWHLNAFGPAAPLALSGRHALRVHTRDGGKSVERVMILFSIAGRDPQD